MFETSGLHLCYVSPASGTSLECHGICAAMSVCEQRVSRCDRREVPERSSVAPRLPFFHSSRLKSCSQAGLHLLLSPQDVIQSLSIQAVLQFPALYTSELLPGSSNFQPRWDSDERSLGGRRDCYLHGCPGLRGSKGCLVAVRLRAGHYSAIRLSCADRFVI